MKHLGLFEGIGGFSLAARWMGWETVAWCEWNEFGQKVLRHHFPEAEGHGDITKTDFTKYEGTIDIITGGFPCQPYSVAGKRKGKEDERHLWPEMLRAIREIQPSWVVGENVLGLVNWDGGLVFNEVQADLEAQGYEILPFVLPACAVNAPHRRDRVWFIAFKNADNNGRRSEQRKEESSERQQRNTGSGNNERISSNNGEIGIITNPNSSGLQKEGAEQQAAGTEQRRELGITTSDSIIERCDNRGYNRQERHIQDNIGITKENQSERERWQCGSCEISSIIADTSGKGLQRGKFNGTSKQGFGSRQSRKPIAEFYKENNWYKFPTQSPVCDGDDGLSARLDSITFPKWRSESIKAGGNAIVPQVAFEIFKAIDKYNNTL